MKYIKFRGINHETGKFVYGFYARLREGVRKFDAILSEENGELVRYYIHSRKTIGQYTGLKGMYEGDIIDDHLLGVGVVEYSDKFAAFRVYYGNGTGKWFYDFLDSEIRAVEIIGNIHESPHLLEEETL